MATLDDLYIIYFLDYQSIFNKQEQLGNISKNASQVL